MPLKSLPSSYAVAVCALAVTPVLAEGRGTQLASALSAVLAYRKSRLLDRQACRVIGGRTSVRYRRLRPDDAHVRARLRALPAAALWLSAALAARIRPTRCGRGLAQAGVNVRRARLRVMRICFSVSMIAKKATPTPTISTPSRNATGSVAKMI